MKPQLTPNHSNAELSRRQKPQRKLEENKRIVKLRRDLRYIQALASRYLSRRAPFIPPKFPNQFQSMQRLQHQQGAHRRAHDTNDTRAHPRRRVGGDLGGARGLARPGHLSSRVAGAIRRRDLGRAGGCGAGGGLGRGAEALVAGRGVLGLGVGRRVRLAAVGRGRLGARHGHGDGGRARAAAGRAGLRRRRPRDRRAEGRLRAVGYGRGEDHGRVACWAHVGVGGCDDGGVHDVLRGWAGWLGRRAAAGAACHWPAGSGRRRRAGAGAC